MDFVLQGGECVAQEETISFSSCVLLRKKIK